MGISEINYKLNKFLTENNPFSGEQDVIYLLVEILKSLDHKNNKNYPWIKFYRDWAVHTKKEGITSEIKSVMQNIYKEIISKEENIHYIISNPQIINFADFKELKTEIDLFLQEHKLPNNLIVERDSWIVFKGLLSKVLTDQPIINPCVGIKSYSITPSNDGCILGEIEYEIKPNEYKIFKFGGAY